MNPVARLYGVLWRNHRAGGMRNPIVGATARPKAVQGKVSDVAREFTTLGAAPPAATPNGVSSLFPQSTLQSREFFFVLPIASPAAVHITRPANPARPIGSFV